MSAWDSLTTKLYLKLNFQKIPIIYPWVYRFENKLSYKKFVEEISKPPKPITVKVLFLEWRSSFDYDLALVKKWLISNGEYRNYITNKEVVESLRLKYSFLPDWISSLEWFLYPDTYHIDANRWNAIEQLVWLQLDNFYNRVRWPNAELFTSFTKKLSNDGFNFRMSTYSIIKLASIIENEEKNNNNKQTIAWLFINRIQNDMLLGADVTLCYGKWISYDLCTPSYIVQHLYESDNPYNTRKVSWLTPTPISNPSIQTIAKVLTYTKTDYLYYLHDNNWKIYYWITLEDHNRNKSLYLK